MADINDQVARFRARGEQFLRLGHDRMKAARFVAEAGGPLVAPVLDVGTGKGLLTMALARLGLNVVSVDMNAEDQALAAYLAKEEGLSDRIRFVLSDAANVSLPDGHFGACAMMDVLHHLEDGARVFRELVRVLRPGGLIVVADFTEAGFELVARVHKDEGQAHPVGPIALQWTEGFLAGLGLDKIGATQGHLHEVRVFRKPARSDNPGQFSIAESRFARMDRGELLKALEVFAKNWLAHDGCWFLAAEERLGTQAAMDLDARSWERFSVAEARRIMTSFGIPENGGLESLEEVLGLRMYAFINPQRVEWSTDRNQLRFYMESCRVQEARRRRGLPDFPCKAVGQVEFSGLARTVDTRIRVSCIYCPPDLSEQRGCGWEFVVKEEPVV